MKKPSTTTTITDIPEDVKQRVERERADQGLPARVADPAALRTIASLIGPKGGRDVS